MKSTEKEGERKCGRYGGKNREDVRKYRSGEILFTLLLQECNIYFSFLSLCISVYCFYCKHIYFIFLCFSFQIIYDANLLCTHNVPYFLSISLTVTLRKERLLLKESKL